MDFEDDNGEVQIFGKNRSKITDLVGYVDSVVENRKLRRSRDQPPTFNGGLEARRKARAPILKNTLRPASHLLVRDEVLRHLPGTV